MENLEEMQNKVIKNYQSINFTKEGHKVVDMLANYIENSTSGKCEKMFCANSPDEMFEKFKCDFENPSNTNISEIISDVLADVTQLHHPNFLGHQVSAPLPSSALADFTAALLNNSNCVYEMGPVACGIEKSVIDWMCKKIGFGKNSGGFLTSGGSLGNLTALLAARQAKSGYNIWQKGVIESEKLCVLVSSECHYSVKRAVAIMGLGEEGAISISSDENFCTDIEVLKTEFEKAQKEGKKVFAVVANACSTAVGSYDNLEAIANFCAKNNLWLHVDGAHGASALLSKTHKKLLKGIEMADSVVWDAHKMMMTSAIVTGVLFKNGEMSHQIFSQNASYILDRNSKTNWFDFALQTLECTKPFMSLKMYVSLKLYGEGFFGEYIDYVHALTSEFSKILNTTEDFEIATIPQSNIICFRYIKNLPDDKLNELQIKIREKLLKSEKYYIVKTQLKNKTYLRCTIINPNTNIKHLNNLINDIRKIAINM